MEGLEHEADRGSAAATARRRRARRRSSLEELLARGRAVEAAQDRQERRLAGAARTHDRELLARLDLEAHTGEGHHLRRAARVGPHHVAQDDEGGALGLGGLQTPQDGMSPGQRRVRGAAAGILQEHAVAAREALFDHDEVGVRRPQHHLALPRPRRGRGSRRCGRRARRRPRAAPERARALLDLDLDARRHAGPQPRLALLDQHAHREELGAAPLLLLLRQRPHQRDLPERRRSG